MYGLGSVVQIAMLVGFWMWLAKIWYLDGEFQHMMKLQISMTNSKLDVTIWWSIILQTEFFIFVIGWFNPLHTYSIEWWSKGTLSFWMKMLHVICKLDFCGSLLVHTQRHTSHSIESREWSRLFLGQTPISDFRQKNMYMCVCLSRSE